MQSPKAAWYTAFEPLEQPELFTLESQNIRTKDVFSILTFNGKVTYF